MPETASLCSEPLPQAQYESLQNSVGGLVENIGRMERDLDNMRDIMSQKADALELQKLALALVGGSGSAAQGEFGRMPCIAHLIVAVWSFCPEVCWLGFLCFTVLAPPVSTGPQRRWKQGFDWITIAGGFV